VKNREMIAHLPAEIKRLGHFLNLSQQILVPSIGDFLYVFHKEMRNTYQI
jgi:hypothetical protein